MNDIDRMKDLLARQRSAFLSQPNRSLAERRADLKKIEAIMLDHRDAWCEAVSADFGHRAQIETLLLELSVVVRGTKDMRHKLGRWMKPERVPTPLMAQPGRSYVRRDPKGVVGIVSPWNYPVQLALLPLATALAAGNRTIIKPSELTPKTNALMADLLAAHFPADQVAVIEGGPDLAEAFCALPFDHLFYTGSTRVGRSVAAAAGNNLVPVTLELGGKSPAIVTADYPVEDAAHAIAWGRFLNAGQTCVAVDNVLAIGTPERARAIGQAVADKVAAFYPDFATNPDYSSVIAGQHFARLEAMVEEARQAGVEIIQPPHDANAVRSSRKFPPTVMINPPDDLRVMREEIFGPVLPVIAKPDLQAATDHVNAHERPLALYVFSNASREIEQVLDNTHSGGVTVNGALLHVANDQLPFGGNGPSGQGAYHGKFGFDELTHARAVFRTRRWHSTRLVAPPYGKLAKKITETALKL
ncbi:coniferyl aldehyde dehydrogenase [uncultured Brevundimonas sp.]|uniref:coniferyl aldehyde dehydrogenase n=1 Tax=uncultured Brevundimonas sp. TaxID=213418 RepID=UPI00262BAA67|nr:coniferyl aldehyde dehydrogenase [uncultured Brevundimonas sp.]